MTTNDAYVITGPTAGIGRATALELSKHGTVVLVGRDAGRLADVQKVIERRGGRALSVVCDLADPDSVARAAKEIVTLKLPIVGVVNNAGIMQLRATRNALGWDMSYATNHLGPFALTEALVPHLADGTNVVFIVSAVEDPERKPAARFGFRGGRYLSVEANARGEWKPGGSTQPGQDAYATSKQAILAAAMALARENPRLHVNAIEPGVTPATSLGRDVNVVVRAISAVLVPILVPLLMPFIKILSTPKRAARVITDVVLDRSGRTGVYYDEGGQPMLASVQARDPAFQDRLVAETRALLVRSRSHTHA